MLIDRFAPEFDATEIHRIEIAAPLEVVWEELWQLNLLGSPVIKALLGVRSLPKLFSAKGRAQARRAKQFTLRDLEGAGFGRLAEHPDPGEPSDGEKNGGHREAVFGVEGRFWRPIDNLSPFRREAFAEAPPPGVCHAYWNFLVHELEPGRSQLSTETRIRAGDRSSRRKFRAYWLFVRPFSGWIRIRMLRSVGKACRRHTL